MARRPKAAKPARKAKLGTVLLVEDDSIIAMAIEDALLDGGATSVTICRTTDDALASQLEQFRQQQTAAAKAMTLPVNE